MVHWPRMSLREFYASLVTTGEVSIDSTDEPPLREIQESKELFRKVDRLTRIDLPGAPPPLSIAAASWAAVTLYRACQFLVCRDLPAKEIGESLSRPVPESLTPSCVYSVDLSFRYLPGLIALSRGLAPEDPLVGGLMRLASEWPLSSVGIPDVAPAEPERLRPILEHGSLLGLYVDRTIARCDLSRLAPAAVRSRVEAALGAHVDLAPPIAAALQGVEQ